MGRRRILSSAWLASTLCAAMMSFGGTVLAATFPEFVDPNPAAGNQFGATVLTLSTGNVVVTSPFDDAGGSDAGAVYLFNGATGALISTLHGSTTNDQLGSNGVTVLTNGNYVVRSPFWNNGAIAEAGAATWGSGTTGVSGVVSAANSLVGSSAIDRVGSAGVTALSNGNYVVSSPFWDNGPALDAGAATWGNGTTGVSGVISSVNSLVGTGFDNRVGGNSFGGATALANGNYVVVSPGWDNGPVSNVGAVTWANGLTGRTGTVSAANSLIGPTTGDNVGGGGVTALPNGNYVVASPNWNLSVPVVAGVGAVTWCDGMSGVVGTVSPANSLVGSNASDGAGSLGVTVLSNGNYVVRSPVWNNGGVSDAGAVTWGNGTTGVKGRRWSMQMA